MNVERPERLVSLAAHPSAERIRRLIARNAVRELDAEWSALNEESA